MTGLVSEYTGLRNNSDPVLKDLTKVRIPLSKPISRRIVTFQDDLSLYHKSQLSRLSIAYQIVH